MTPSDKSACRQGRKDDVHLDEENQVTDEVGDFAGSCTGKTPDAFNTNCYCLRHKYGWTQHSLPPSKIAKRPASSMSAEITISDHAGGDEMPAEIRHTDRVKDEKACTEDNSIHWDKKSSAVQEEVMEEEASRKKYLWRPF